MALHDDLLEQANQLAHVDKKKPKQANLRRAVSAAYYALFHFLVDQSSRFLVASPGRKALRHQLARAFDHGHMKRTAQAFVAATSANPWRAVLTVSPSASVAAVADAFIALQEARHEADYDLARGFTRGEVEALVARAEAAVLSWESVKRVEADVFLVGLAVKGRN